MQGATCEQVPGFGEQVIWLGAKNIMTGVNVASRMRRDSFVAEKIDNQLTANPADFTAAVTRIFFTRRLSAQRRQDQ